MNQQLTTASASLRPMGLPRSVAVRVDAGGHPLSVVRVDARGRPGTEARVERIEEVWRVAESWWRESSQARTYYRVVLDRGRPLTLFRDDAAGNWFEQPYTAASR